jgi:protein subunit release factor A
MDIDAFRGRNAYVLLGNDSHVASTGLAAIAVNEVTNAYSRVTEQRGWRTDRLNAWVSWRHYDKSATIRVSGWEAFGVLSEKQNRHCGQYARPGGKGRRVEVCVQAYVVPEAYEYEWEPYLKDVREEVFYSFASAGMSPVAAGVSLTHKPTLSSTSCREVDPIYAPGLGQYTLERNRNAAWSFLLDHLRMIGPNAAKR